MSDIVDRLIALGATLANDEAETVQQAADKIARLTAEVERLQAVSNSWINAAITKDELMAEQQAVVDAARAVLPRGIRGPSWTIEERALDDALRALDGERCMWCGADRMGNDEICPKCQHSVSDMIRRG